MSTLANHLIKEPVGRIMNKLSRLYLANLHQNLTHLDIKRSYYPLLLIEAGKGELTQKELAEKLVCDKVQVVRIIDYLSSKGYVERKQCENDRRKCCLKITEKARKFIPDIKDAIEKTTKLTFNGLPEKKVDELYNLLEKIDTNLSPDKVN